MDHFEAFALIQICFYCKNKLCKNRQKDASTQYMPKNILQLVWGYLHKLCERIVIFGGCRGLYTDECLAYDWQQNDWEKLPFECPRNIYPAQKATRITNTQTLIVGGPNADKELNVCIYNTRNNTSTPVGKMNTKMKTADILINSCTFNAFDDRYCLCIGTRNRFFNTVIEIYDILTCTWTLVNSNNWDSYRSTKVKFSAVVLNNNSVLVTGGTFALTQYASCEIFDTSTMTFSNVASMKTPRYDHASVLLSNGHVLVTGGRDNYACLSSCEIYSPLTDTWSDAPSMLACRSLHACVLLPNNTVMVISGFGYNSASAMCEIFNVSLQQWTFAAPMPEDWLATEFAYALC